MDDDNFNDSDFKPRFPIRAVFFIAGVFLFIMILVILCNNNSSAAPSNDGFDLLSHNDGDELFAGRQYTWRVLVSDSDGANQIADVVLHLDYDNTSGSDQTITWNRTTDTFSSSSTYFTVDSTATDSSSAVNQWTLDFKITFNWNWAGRDDPGSFTDDRVETINATSTTANTDYNKDSWSCENELILYDVEFDCNDNRESGTGTIEDGDWLRGSTSLTSITGTIVYEGTTNEIPPSSATIYAQLFLDGSVAPGDNDDGPNGITHADSYDTEINYGDGSFSINTTTVGSSTDNDYDLDVRIEGIPTGGGESTTGAEDHVDSRIDATLPTVDDGDWSESSIYLFVDLTNDNTNNRIYYSNQMSSGQTGTLSFDCSDNAGLAQISYQTAVGHDGSPDSLSGTSDTAVVIYDFDSGDNFNGLISITVTDAVGNSDIYSNTWRITRDTSDPPINYNDPGAGENTTYYSTPPGNVIDIDFYVGGANDAPLWNASYQIEGYPWDRIFQGISFSNYNADWALNWSNLTDGRNNISLRVYDCVGNVRIHNYVFNTTGFGFLRDTKVPRIVYNYPTAGNDTNWYSSDPQKIIDIDFVKRGISPLINASYSINGGPWLPIFNTTQSSDYTDNWNISWSEIIEGENLISIRVFNNAKIGTFHMFSTTVTGFKFLTDWTDPSITYNNPSAGGNTSWFNSNPSDFINIDFGWIANSPLDYAQYRINNGNWEDIFTADQQSDYVNNWGIPWASLPEGVSNISSRVFDLAGNVKTDNFQAGVRGFRFRKDITDPGIEYNYPTIGGNSSWYSVDPGAVINIDFIWVADSPIDYAQYKIGDGSWEFIFGVDQDGDFNDEWSITWADLVEGENIISIRVADKAGNLVLEEYDMNLAGFMFWKDTVAPKANLISINNGAHFTNESSVTLSLSATDATSGIYQMRISNDGTFDTELWEDYSTTKLWTLTGSDGNKTVYIRFRDRALIESAIINDKIILDTQTPLFTNWTQKDINEDTTSLFKIIVTVEDNVSGVFKVYINYTIEGFNSSGFKVLKYIGGNDWQFTIESTEFGLGQTWDSLQGSSIEYIIRAEDNAGNVLYSQKRYEYIDSVNDPPVIKGAPTEIEVTATKNYELDFSVYISDVDNSLSELVVSTDSNYATINGHTITFNYPYAISSETVNITVSDGLNNTKWPIQITVKIPKVIKVYTQGPVTTRVLIAINGEATLTTGVTPPGSAPNGMINLLTFKIEFDTNDWDWLHIKVDYSNLNISNINVSTLKVYYWDSSDSKWVQSNKLGIDTSLNFIDANVTKTRTFAVIGVELPNQDIDGDSMLDKWESANGLDPTDKSDATEDPDGEGLLNIDEFKHRTDPKDPDTDDDGLPDKWEVDFSLDPKDNTGDNGATGDPDGDKHDNLDEFEHNTDPNDDTDYYKKSEKADDNFMAIAGIVVVIVIILLLLIFMFLRGRGGTEERETKPGGPKIVGPVEGEEGMEGEEVEGLEEEYPYDDESKPADYEGVDVGDIADELAEEMELGAEPEIGAPLKPEVQTLALEEKMEVMELGVVLPCSVCQGIMPVGEKVFQCTCGLVSHKDCLSGIEICPQCGKEITIPELKKVKVTKKLPMIKAEVKREVQEQTPPTKAHFSFIPGKNNDKELSGYIGGYYKNNELGPIKENDDLRFVRLFITPESAKIMLDHCYKHGRVKEVMGLMIGQTFSYKDDVFSVVKDVVTSELDATEVNVKFDSFEKLFDQLDNITYDYQIIGWYHSHPNYTSFMSPTDANTQQRMFKHPYQYAIVIDPIRFDMNAFTLDQTRKNKVKEKPFAITEMDK